MIHLGACHIPRQRFHQLVDFGSGARDQDPARLGAEAFPPSLHPGRRVVRGVEADGDQVNVFAHALAEPLLQIGEGRPGSRADVFAGGVDEVDDDHFASNKIAMKSQSFVVLVLNKHIGDRYLRFGSGRFLNALGTGAAVTQRNQAAKNRDRDGVLFEPRKDHKNFLYWIWITFATEGTPWLLTINSR